jgi:hypothetical protein
MMVLMQSQVLPSPLVGEGVPKGRVRGIDKSDPSSDFASLSHLLPQGEKEEACLHSVLFS